MSISNYLRLDAEGGRGVEKKGILFHIQVDKINEMKMDMDEKARDIMSRK